MSQATISHDTGNFENYTVMLPTTEYDRKTFESLYDKHSPKNFGYILKHTDTKLEAEELLTSVYLKMWNNIKYYVDNNDAEKRIIALVLTEVKLYNQKKNCNSLPASKFYTWAYNTFMLAAVIYLFFIK